MASLAFVFPLTPGKTEEWRSWRQEILGPRRSEYQAFRRHLSFTAHRMYLQHTPQGDAAILYLEGDDQSMKPTTRLESGTALQVQSRPSEY